MKRFGAEIWHYIINNVSLLEPLLQYPAFAELRDLKQFIQFGLSGTLFWANGADIAPEYLYDHGVIYKAA